MIPDEPYILLIGSFPPPVGGISVHVERLQSLLQEDYRVVVLDLYGQPSVEYDRSDLVRVRPLSIKKLLIFFRLLSSRHCLVAHFHVSAMSKFSHIAPILLRFIRKNTKLLLTLHSGSFIAYYESRATHRKKSLFRMLKKFDVIISVSNEQKNYLANIGLNKETILVVPAFLPPTAIYSASVDQEICRLREKSRILLVSSGYALPLYGFDKIIEALNTVSQLSESIGLIFCFYNTYDEQYLEKIKNSLGPDQEHALFYDMSSNEFAYLLSKTDIYVRATDRDGDAVAIREASFFNNQIIASDVVNRADGVILFDLNNIDSLVGSIELAVKDKQKGRLTSEMSLTKDMIKQSYSELLSERS